MGDTSEGNEILSVLELRPGQVPPALPLPPWVAALTLPVVPEGVTWKQLRLKVRTEKRVRKLASTPQELHRLTVGDLMGQYGFGWASLFDLLYSLRRAGAVGDGCSPGEQVGHRPETPSIQTEVPPAWSLHGPSPMLARKLPVAPEGATWPDLGLRALTERRLQRVAATPQELSRWTIGQLFRLVGKKSTFELLTALQHVGATAATAEGASRGAKSWDVLRLARQIQRSSDAARIHWDDHRFGTLIRAVDAHAQTAAEVGASLGDGMPVDAPAEKLVPMLSKLVHAIRRSRQIPLEEELAELLLAEPSQRRRDMVALYLGWDGGGGTTLAQVGRKYGLTRERVRQICACLLERLKAVRVFAPVLDQVVDFVERHTPLPAAEVESKLIKPLINKQTFAWFSAILEGCGRTMLVSWTIRP
ncbi:MAG: hypothetical protein FJ279_16400, partial [Planctomycetes bacterium]|nr:hypothetical protein [Planctomycetota bacterium]